MYNWKRIFSFFSSKSGFSAAEMAMVVAAVAVVVGTVIAGKGMVQKAKIGDVVDDVRKFIEATNNFEKAYKSLPGDMANVSSLPSAGGVAGNGNGSIDSDAEALQFWQHLSLGKKLKEKYDGSSTYIPGTGVPASSISGGGYRILNPSAISMPSQSLIIELSGYTSASNTEPALTPEEAKIIEELMKDDGKPNSGKIIAVGTNTDCATGLEKDDDYNLANKSVACRLQFIIRQSNQAASATLSGGVCNKAGLSREVSDPTKTCPPGFFGVVEEKCNINTTKDGQGIGTGTWVISKPSCQAVLCSGGKKFGERKVVPCANGQKGMGVTQICTSEGVWKTESVSCAVDTPACGTNGQEKQPMACNWSQTGRVTQTCSSGTWSTTGNTCALIQCSGNVNVGISQTSATTCGANYTGSVTETCTMDGTWKITSNTCAPSYSGACTAGTTRNIGCPPGETGQHTQVCVDFDNNDYWTTQSNTCAPVTCSGERVGTARIVKERPCPNNRSGIVIEVCQSDASNPPKGEWITSFSQCASVMCDANKDTAGFASWPYAAAGANGITGTCLPGYRVDQIAPPFRNCNSSGVWSNPTYPCVRGVCVGGTDDNATWPATNSLTENVRGACTWPDYEGDPIRDCDNLGNWSSTKSPCKLSALPIKANLRLWFDAADSSTVFTDTTCSTRAQNGQGVACWKDKSGNATNATQSTAGNRPTLQQVAFQSTNAAFKPVLMFNGTTNFLQTASTVALSANAASVFAVARAGNAPDHTRIIHFTSSDPVFFFGAFNQLFATFFGNNGSTWNDSDPNTPNINISTKYNVLSVIQNGNDNPYVNGVAQTSNANPMSAVTATVKIGAREGGGYWQNGIAEIILYTRALDVQEKYEVENYLANKWGIVLSPPVSSGMTLWLDAADASSIYTSNDCATGQAPADGSTIGCWKDKSGQNLHVTQSSAGNRPSYVQNAQNNNPALAFNGSNQWLSRAAVVGSSISAASEVSVILAMKYITPMHGNAVFFWETSPNSNRLGTHLVWANGVAMFDFGLAYTRVEAAPTNFTDKWSIISMLKRTDNTASIYHNGTQFASSTTMNSNLTTASSATLYIGRTVDPNYLRGQLAELMFYNKAVTNSERTAIENYLAKKWGIAVSPPVTAGLKLWLDAADSSTLFGSNDCATTPMPADAGAIGCWRDKSGYGNNATQATAGNRPIRKTSILNSKDIVRFDGTNDFFSIPDNIIANGNTPYTIFTTVKAYLLNTAGSISGMFNFGSFNVVNQANAFRFASTGLVVDYWWAADIVTNAGSVADNTLYLFSFNYNTTTGRKIYINGNLAASNATTGRNGVNSGLGYIGSSYNANLEYLYGDMGEVAVYNRSLTDIERRSMESYLGTKWGINVNTAPNNGLVLWLDASDSSTLFTASNCTGAAANSNSVACWKDKSQSAANFTAGTAPVYNATTITGKPALGFDNPSYQYLTRAYTAAINPSTGTLITVARGYSVPAANTIRPIYGFSNDTAASWSGHMMLTIDNLGSGWFGTGATSGYMKTSSYGSSSTAYNINTSPFVTTFTFKSGQQALYTNGYSAGSNSLSYGPAQAGTSAFIGANKAPGGIGWHGEINEIRLYNTILSAADRISVEKSLINKWNIILPLPVTSSLKLWLDGSDLTSIYTGSDCSTGQAPATNTYIGCWKDKSGNGYNATQSTGANQPSVQYNIVNGKSIIRGRANVGYLSFAGGGIPYNSNALTFIVVASPSISNNTNSYIFGSIGSLNASPSMLSKYGAVNYEFYGDTPRFTLSSSATGANILSVVTTGSGGTTSGYLNGTLVTSGAGITTGNGRTLGYILSAGPSAGFFTGDMAEFILYNRALSNSERISVENYLKDKWGL